MTTRWITIAALNAATGFAVAYGLTHDWRQALAVAGLQSILLRIAVALGVRAPAPLAAGTATSRSRRPPARPRRWAEA